MIYWSGLGMTYNYDGTGASVSADMDTLYGLGFRKLRMLFTDYTNSSQITTWRGYVTTALSKGFYVVYGITAGFAATTTAANYGAFSTAVQAEATWAQGVNNVSHI